MNVEKKKVVGAGGFRTVEVHQVSQLEASEILRDDGW